MSWADLLTVSGRAVIVAAGTPVGSASYSYPWHFNQVFLRPIHEKILFKWNFCVRSDHSQKKFWCRLLTLCNRRKANVRRYWPDVACHFCWHLPWWSVNRFHYFEQLEIWFPDKFSVGRWSYFCHRLFQTLTKIQWASTKVLFFARTIDQMLQEGEVSRTSPMSYVLPLWE